jgi:8-amino-7-oxononanoate synthase
MHKFPQALQNKIDQRTTDNSLRVPGNIGSDVDFSSNDYLGLAASAELFEATHNFLKSKNITQNGATGSRLLTGNYTLYDEVEDFLATLHEAESALVFNSGYDANMGFFSSVPQKGDIVLYDEYIHASIRDGLRLSGATVYKFAHNDKEALFKMVERYRHKAQELYIVTESVFSMDGDTPNLAEYVYTAQRYRCRLVVDEAHAVGIFGEKGEGLLQAYGLQDEVFARIVTFGKAMGCHGAAVLGAAELKTYLTNFARSFIYTTGLPPHSLGAIQSSYNHISQYPELLVDLHNTIMHFKGETERCHLPFILSFSAIHCIVIPGNEKVKKIAKVLQRAGYAVKPILSPTVPAGQERLRICLHVFNTRRQISAMMDLLTQAIRYS